MSIEELANNLNDAAQKNIEYSVEVEDIIHLFVEGKAKTKTLQYVPNYPCLCSTFIDHKGLMNWQ